MLVLCELMLCLEAYLPEENIPREVYQRVQKDKTSVIVFFNTYSNIVFAESVINLQLEGETLTITWEKIYYPSLPEKLEPQTESYYHFVSATDLTKVSKVKLVENAFTITLDGKVEPTDTVETILNIFPTNP